jgi:CubicO group peptidase (beta-lactamase class C family)
MLRFAAAESAMRSTVPWAICILAVLVASSQQIFSGGQTTDNFTESQSDVRRAGPSKRSEDSVHVERVENGLIPAVILKGQPTPKMRLGERMAHYKIHGVSMAFFDHGRVRWTRAYGFADVAGKKQVTRDTLFQAGSVSKPIAALAALRLVQDGRLSLDEDVNIKLRSWKVPDNEFTAEQKVTLRRILSHSAGLTVHGFPGYESGEQKPSIVQILNGEKPANSAPVRVDAVPGTSWRYSGGGYVVMQLLLTEITQTAFPHMLHDLVLQPAGMTHSTYEQPLPENLSGFAATPYLTNGEPVQGGWHSYPEMAAAGLWTTPSDLARLAIEVQKEYAGTSSKILSQETMRQMLTHQKGDWGLGFDLGPPGGAQRFGHSGDDAGFQCELVAYIGSSQGVAIMTNSDNGYRLTAEVIRAISNEYGWPDYKPKERGLAKIDPSLLGLYVGTYERPDIGNQVVSVKNNRLYLQEKPLGPEPEELFPDSDTEFFILSNDVTFSFQKDGRGLVSKLVTHIGGEAREANRIFPVQQ